VAAPLQAPAHDLDHQLAIGTRIAEAGVGLSAVAAVFLAIEVHLFVQAAIAAGLGCLATWALFALMRLLVPIMAIAAPYVAAVIVIAGLGGAAWYWNKRKAKKKAKAVPLPPEAPKA
jgi:hypothetical protein